MIVSVPRFRLIKDRVYALVEACRVSPEFRTNEVCVSGATIYRYITIKRRIAVRNLRTAVFSYIFKNTLQ